MSVKVGRIDSIEIPRTAECPELNGMSDLELLQLELDIEAGHYGDAMDALHDTVLNMCGNRHLFDRGPASFYELNEDGDSLMET
jgi:hypothetical protein